MDRFNPDVSFTALEPRIIDEDLIRKALDDEGPKGEAGRLMLQDGIILAEVTCIRLEFFKILAIDHLWMMTSLVKLNLSNNIIEKIENLEALVNLKELSLSFNYIKNIENLDKLTKLEILTLFENLISRIENLETLTDLKILSIGNNIISNWDDVVYLRKFKGLYSLNMAGNPCCSENHLGDGKRSKPKDGESIVEIDAKFGDGELIEPKQRKREFEIYTAAMLPQLCYYEYRLVNEEDRSEGQQKYRHKLLNLSNEEEKEEIALQKAKEEEELINKEKSAWVENLRGSELFREMFTSEPYGDALVNLDETMQEMYEEFKTEFTKTTRGLYEVGLAKKLERDEEENQFLSCLEAAKEETRKEGEGIMTELFKERDHTFSEISRLAQRLESEEGAIRSASKNTENANGDAGDALIEVSTLGEEDFAEEELVARMHSLGEEFKNHCNKVWSQLMALETHLYEQIEETISTFERNLSELVSSFIEAAQVHFVSCREFANQFHEKITTYAPRYFAATKARIAACQERLYMTDEDDESDENSISIQGQETKDDCPSVPKILEQCLDDKEVLQNMLISSQDTHIQVIDTKEDTMMSYSKEWLKEKIEKYTREEIEGNRKRLHEIITVTNLLKEELVELQEASITLPMLAEMELLDG